MSAYSSHLVFNGIVQELGDTFVSHVASVVPDPDQDTIVDQLVQEMSRDSKINWGVARFERGHFPASPTE